MFPEISKVIENVTNNINELKTWLNNISYSDGCCNVLCVGFTEGFGADYHNTMYVDDDGYAQRKPYTIIPYLLNEKTAKKIMSTVKFNYEGKPVTPTYELVRIDKWASKVLKSMGETLDTLKKVEAGAQA